MNKIDNKNIFICPSYNCKQIPELSYSYEPINPTIKLKCNSKMHQEFEKKINLEEFLKNLSFKVECSYCNGKIEDFEFIYNKKNSFFYHVNCLGNIEDIFKLNDEYHIINQNTIFNNCLVHDKKFLFYCPNCKISLCSRCDLDTHNEKGHILQQLISLRKNQNIIDESKSIISKQWRLLNKIKEMNTKIFKSFENDIIIKEKIIGNYEKNINNYQSIQNFNGLELKFNEEYEKLLYNIINKYNEYEKNQNVKMGDKILSEILLSPLYYSMMIYNNKDFNNYINNKIKYDFPDDSESEENEKSDSIFNINIIDNNKDLSTAPAYQGFANINPPKKDYIHKNIAIIKQEKSIFNLIILRSGNIATSSVGAVTIYDSKNLLSPNKENYILQTIGIFKKKKVSYVFEFPDETLFCSVYSKIFHLKLIDDDKRYNILGFIPLNKSELPSKLISLDNTFLAVLTVITGNSFIRLFINKKEYERNNDKFKNFNEINNIDNDKLIDENYYNSDDQSAGILNDLIEFPDKKKIEIDKEFLPFSKQNNINLDLKLLCSIFEIKKISNNNKYGLRYDFIATSNSTYDYGEDKIIFFIVKKKMNESIKVKIKKTISNVSCSTEADSICQLNNKFICIGLQNHNNENQKNGFAIINIQKKDILKIIKDLPIYSLAYSFEKKLLFSAMDIIEKGNKHKYLITVYEIIEGIDEIFSNQIYQYKSDYSDIIVSLSQIKNNEIINRKNNEENIILVSSSLDSTIRLTEISKIKNN